MSLSKDSLWCGAGGLTVGRKLGLINAFALVATRNRLLRCIVKNASPITCKHGGKSAVLPSKLFFFLANLRDMPMATAEG